MSQQQQTESRNGHPSPTANYDDVVQSPDLFWEKLRAFLKSLGLKFKVPVVGGKDLDLDLHQLFVEVTSRGGLEKVLQVYQQFSRYGQIELFYPVFEKARERR